MIRYNVPAVTGREEAHLRQAIAGQRLAGDGPYTRKCEAFLERLLGAPKVLLTPSCTAALEMSALLLGVGEGDEIIMPSYNFVSGANAFALRGAKVVFVDVAPDTMNVDPECIRAAVTKNTKAIVVVHYAGVGCEMDEICEIAAGAGAAVVEDAAQGIGARYKDRPLGTIGDLGCISFHETKNIQCGEGGALVINNPDLIKRAEILREKGTDRSRFLRGEIDKYTWVDVGSSFLMSELNAAFLLPQLEDLDRITARRLEIWQRYHAAFSNSAYETPRPPAACEHNAHIYWLKTQNGTARDALIEGLRLDGVQAPFHYIPLHATAPGRKFGTFGGEDKWTTRESERLLRLPVHLSLTPDEQETVIAALSRRMG
jgi:dTDP-4-amino-4,6-dideoxygalactose transaminase